MWQPIWMSMNTTEKKSVSVKIKDVRLHGVKQDKLVVGRQYYEKYCRHEPLEEKIREYICPQREDVAGLYRFLRQCGGLPSATICCGAA